MSEQSDARTQDQSADSTSKYVVQASQPYDWTLAIITAKNEDDARSAFDDYESIDYVIEFEEWVGGVRDGFDIPHMVEFDGREGVGWCR